MQDLQQSFGTGNPSFDLKTCHQRYTHNRLEKSKVNKQTHDLHESTKSNSEFVDLKSLEAATKWASLVLRAQKTQSSQVAM